MFLIETMADLPLKFAADLWNALIDEVKVFSDKRVEFRFKNGAEIEKISE